MLRRLYSLQARQMKPTEDKTAAGVHVVKNKPRSSHVCSSPTVTDAEVPTRLMFAVSLMPSAGHVPKLVTLPKFVVVNLSTTVPVLPILRTKDQIGLILWRLLPLLKHPCLFRHQLSHCLLTHHPHISCSLSSLNLNRSCFQSQ